MAFLRRYRSAPPAADSAPLRSIGRTHVGHIRSINEDRILDRPDLGLWAVADGMGGQSHGDIAADTAISNLAQLTAPIEAPRIVGALEAANRQIFDISGGQSGTTVVALHIDGADAALWWAGDSRAYLIRRDRLQLLTRDHSLVQDLVDAGLVEPGDAANHPQSNVITRALGTSSHVELETLALRVEPGDRILLCSDGLSRTIGQADVMTGASLADQVDRWMDKTLARDGSDNISLVLVESLATPGA